jgi:adhesin transport system outer membrane protein
MDKMSSAYTVLYKSIFLKAFVLLSCVSLSSQAATNALTLPDALALSVGSHPAIAAKKNDFLASESALEGSFYQMYPSISAQSTAMPINGAPSRINSVRLEQPIWTGGKISSQIDAAKSRLGSARYSLNEAEQEILGRTAAAFIEVIRMSLRIEAADENVYEFQRLLELIQRRAKSEVSPRSEVVVAKARLEQSKSEKLNLEASYLNAKSDLEQLISRKVYNLAFPVPNLSLSGDLEGMIEQVVRSAPVLKKADYEIQASEADLNIKKSVLMPQISLRYERFWSELSNRDANIAYVAVTYQPGAGLSSFSAINEMQSKKLSTELNADNAKKDLVDKVRIDWNRVKSASNQIEILKELIESTRDVYESYVRQYAAGRKTWVEVLNARREYTQAKNMLVDEEWGGFLAKMKLEVACSCGSVSNLISNSNQ